jgi:hypothetical protein
MNILQAQHLRQLTGWLTAALLFTALACLADALAAGFKGETRILQGVPGSKLPINAPLPAGAQSISEIRVLGGDDRVTLIPDEVFTGFWLGGTMWRGNVVVSPDARPGTWVLTLEGPPLAEKPKGMLPVIFTVTVHEDALAQQKASASIITRYTGYEPFAVSALLAGLAIPGGLAGFLLSRRIEQLLTLEGKAIVYMVKKSEEGTLIGFSLGLEHGLSKGMSVRFQKADGSETGYGRVVASQPQDSTVLLLSGTCAMGDMAVLSSGDVPRHGADT